MKNFEIEGVLESPQACCCCSKPVIGVEGHFACPKVVVAAELANWWEWLFDIPLEHMEELDNESMPQVSESKLENVDHEMEDGSGDCP